MSAEPQYVVAVRYGLEDVAFYGFSTRKFVSEYPDAAKYDDYKLALRAWRSAHGRGYVAVIVENYGTTDERVVLS